MKPAIAGVLLLASLMLAGADVQHANPTDWGAAEILKQGILGVFCAVFMGLAWLKDRETKAAVKEHAAELKMLHVEHAATIKAMRLEHAENLEERDETILRLTADTAKERTEMISVLRRYAANS